MLRTQVVKRHGLRLVEVLAEQEKPSPLQTDVDRRRIRRQALEAQRLAAVAEVRVRKEREKAARLAAEAERREAERRMAREDKQARELAAAAGGMPSGRSCGCGRPLARGKRLCPKCRAAHRQKAVRAYRRAPRPKKGQTVIEVTSQVLAGQGSIFGLFDKLT